MSEHNGWCAIYGCPHSPEEIGQGQKVSDTEALDRLLKNKLVVLSPVELCLRQSWIMFVADRPTTQKAIEQYYALLARLEKAEEDKLVAEKRVEELEQALRAIIENDGVASKSVIRRILAS